MGEPILADARHPDGAALWVEAGRSFQNFGFLQHVVEAAMSSEIDHAVVAVVQTYKGASSFPRCQAFLDDVFATSGLQWPLKSVVLIGY